MIIPFAVLATLAYVSAAATKRPDIYSDPAQFYSRLSHRRQSEILHSVNLADPKELEALLGLLKYNQLEILKNYNAGCGRITEERAEAILNVVVENKQIEALLLGAGCLSPIIIEVRKRRNVWPPIGFPLLIPGLKLNNVSIDHVKELLEEALKEPSWWFSGDWTSGVNLDELNDLRFWRMIPLISEAAANPTIYRYQKRALLSITNYTTHHDLEEALMKISRLLYFMNRTEGDLEVATFICAANGLASKFSHLSNSWSQKVLGSIAKVCMGGFLGEQILFQDLLELDAWMPSIDDGAFERGLLLNDITELVILARHFWTKRNCKTVAMLQRNFINDVAGWTGLRPVTMNALTEAEREVLPPCCVS